MEINAHERCKHYFLEGRAVLKTENFHDLSKEASEKIHKKRKYNGENCCAYVRVEKSVQRIAINVEE
jgi:hypothetical protein